LLDPQGGSFTVKVPHAFTDCDRELEPCAYQDGAMLTVLSDYQRLGTVWVAGREQQFILPFAASAFTERARWDAPATPHKFILRTNDSFSTLNTDTGEIQTLATFPPRDPVFRRSDWLLSDVTSKAGMRTIEIAPMKMNAAWETLVEFELTDLVAHYLIGRPGNWYFITAPRKSDSYSVFKLANGKLTLLSEGADPMLAQVLYVYNYGQTELEEGHIATGTGCLNGSCSLRRIDLEKAATEILDEVTLEQGDSVLVQGEHSISCGAVDAMIVDETENDIKYWSIRLRP
jgi:hypothetical protein